MDTPTHPTTPAPRTSGAPTGRVHVTHHAVTLSIIGALACLTAATTAATTHAGPGIVTAYVVAAAVSCLTTAHTTARYRTQP